RSAGERAGGVERGVADLDRAGGERAVHAVEIHAPPTLQIAGGESARAEARHRDEARELGALGDREEQIAPGRRAVGVRGELAVELGGRATDGAAGAHGRAAEAREPLAASTAHAAVGEG